MFYEILKNEISEATVTHPLEAAATNIPQNVGPNELSALFLWSLLLFSYKMQKKKNQSKQKAPLLIFLWCFQLGYFNIKNQNPKSEEAKENNNKRNGH